MVMIELSRVDLINKIQDIISGIEKREVISEWALSIINDENFRVKDPVVWDILECLGAIDLPSTDRSYLYTDEDFNYWISKLRKNS